MEETISLKELFETLRKRLWMILTITAIAAIAAAIISYFYITPVYQSSTLVVVNQSKADQVGMANGIDIRSNTQYINTYSDIIKSPAILEKVSAELDGRRSAGQISGQTTIGGRSDSIVFTITVKDTDPEMAANIANTTAAVFQKQLPTILNVDNVSILSQAAVSEAPISPIPTRNIMIAIVVGLMASIGLAFLLDFLDNTIKTEQDIEKTLGLPVLGAVTKIDLENEMDFSKLDKNNSIGGETIGA
ncbi:capsular biosynthesis protein [Lottiidibacillus patelloidae]|uniref:Capsular biosynthesis protein n=1 Tax=Lottiidibacillus patelloidae TaxID=2670334 RepID=A0A263BSQ3_9BACI|nr:Wzz/FepE/Etk N-terminal domain-containing protein [Lottiidibacillus patelloidae]OZM56397.1 capsular biosynthesis protein [Lottiidibacillus patelloidae]